MPTPSTHLLMKPESGGTPTMPKRGDREGGHGQRHAPRRAGQFRDLADARLARQQAGAEEQRALEEGVVADVHQRARRSPRRPAATPPAAT
jgi:hypothetical protein